jgi:hypothetical protein
MTRDAFEGMVRDLIGAAPPSRSSAQRPMKRAMPAPSSRRGDPFRPPGHEEKPLELAAPPAAPAAKGTMSPPGSAPAALSPRKPVKYRRPLVSWVTVVVLGFAVVGAAAVGNMAFRRVTRIALTPRATTRTAPAAPVVYRELAKDDAVLVNIQVSPREARLMLDGEPLVSNPVRLPRGPAVHSLAGTADGYAPMVEEFTADKPKTVHLKLGRPRR